MRAPLTEAEIRALRKASRADPRCADELWFVLMARAIEEHHHVPSPGNSCKPAPGSNERRFYDGVMAAISTLMTAAPDKDTDAGRALIALASTVEEYEKACLAPPFGDYVVPEPTPTPELERLLREHADANFSAGEYDRHTADEGYEVIHARAELARQAIRNFVGRATTPTPAASPEIERWIVSKETTVDWPGRELPVLGYTVLSDAKPFPSFDAASAWIRANGLPLGWVAAEKRQTPWCDLLLAPEPTAPTDLRSREDACRQCTPVTQTLGWKCSERCRITHTPGGT